MSDVYRLVNAIEDRQQIFGMMSVIQQNKGFVYYFGRANGIPIGKRMESG